MAWLRTVALPSKVRAMEATEGEVLELGEKEVAGKTTLQPLLPPSCGRMMWRTTMAWTTTTAATMTTTTTRLPTPLPSCRRQRAVDGASE
jgi:hypothetical protein